MPKLNWKEKVNYILGLIPETPKVLDLSQSENKAIPVVQIEQKPIKNLDKSTQIIHIKHIE